MVNAPSRVGESYWQIVPVITGLADMLAKEIQDGYKKGFDAALPEVEVPENEEQFEDAGKKGSKAYGKAFVAGIAALGLGAVVSKMVGSAVEQQSSNNRVAAALALTDEERKVVAESARDLYTGAYGESYEAVNGALKQIVGSIKGARQMSSEELTEMGKDVLNLADNFELGSDQILMATQAQIGTGFAKNAKEGMSNIAAAYQMLGANGSDAIDTLTQYSGDFVQMGLDGAEAIQYMNAGLEAGAYNTDTLSDGIREFGIKLRAMDSAEAIGALGLDPADIRERIAAGGDAAQGAMFEVISKLQEAGTDSSLWEQVLGGQTDDFFLTFKNIDLSGINGQLEGTIGNLERIDEISGSGSAATMTSFLRTIEEIFVEIITPILEALTPILMDVANFLKENEWAAGILAATVGGVLALAVVGITANFIAGAVAGWAFLAPMLPMVAAVAGLGAAFGVLGYAVKLAFEFATMGWDAFYEKLQKDMPWLAYVLNEIFESFVIVLDALSDLMGWKGASSGNNAPLVWNGSELVAPTAPGSSGGGGGGGGVGADESFTGSFSDKLPSKFGGSFADGGTVPARAGGTLAIIGEAGRNEVIMDEGKWNGLIDSILSGKVGTGGVTQHITLVQRENEDPDALIERLKARMDFTSLGANSDYSEAF